MLLQVMYKEGLCHILIISYFPKVDTIKVIVTYLISPQTNHNHKDVTKMIRCQLISSYV